MSNSNVLKVSVDIELAYDHRPYLRRWLRRSVKACILKSIGAGGDKTGGEKMLSRSGPAPVFQVTVAEAILNRIREEAKA